MKEAIRQKKVEYQKMCLNRSEKTKTKWKNIKNQTKKVITNFMTTETEEELTKLNKKPNNIFKLMKLIKKMGKNIQAHEGMREKDEKLGFSEKDRKQLWKII